MRKGSMVICALALVFCMVTLWPMTAEGANSAAADSDPISRQEAKGFLLLLGQEYCDRNQDGFMSLVSSRFRGDDFVLANAVRKDFRLLSEVNIRFSAIQVTISGNMATITANYRRTVVPVGSGEMLNDSGITEVTAVREDGELKLYSMKNPVLFGLSNASEVATGTISSGQNHRTLHISREGRIYVGMGSEDSE